MSKQKCSFKDRVLRLGTKSTDIMKMSELLDRKLVLFNVSTLHYLEICLKFIAALKLAVEIHNNYASWHPIRNRMSEKD